ncbi:hypothetical protein C5167_005440 [Papaver somniferum]|uniref:RNA helicase n=1 Tax=Papaver somniferum TaxID=3469 RepID=A0A4Y7JAH0_PAPSO|nr:hypothetical protein C5167_005440 [Papaver somniferum]
MLIRSNDEQETVSRDKKDRHEFEQLSALATRMGLYSRQYARAVVVSKVPLPNYRFDLDDKRPQREVVIHFGLERRVDVLLREHFSRKPWNIGSMPKVSFSRSSSYGSIATDDGLFEQQELQTSTSAVMEKIIKRRSLHLRSQQQAWQESEEGQKMQAFRKSLPAYKERDALLTTISQNQHCRWHPISNSCSATAGETGCGKTTQIPQYILESEIESGHGALCNVICTQPRRISAMAVSERVAAERGEKIGESVGYKVRLEGIKSRDTRLLFCTTGILLRRLLVDRNLKGVTHVIVDEIHERGMNEDFLLIVLKDLLPRRPELRLILMSATLNAELFSSYFGGAPMLQIPGFTYPVQTHLLEDVLDMTGYKLTPYNQVDDYGQDKTWKTQKQGVRKRKSRIAFVVEDALEAANFKEYTPQTRDSLSCWNPDLIGFNLIENILCHICQKERPGAVLRLIFDKPDGEARKIVLATNMAETSITINDVVFVVDCGKAKESSYDALNNTPCLLPSWISKATALQIVMEEKGAESLTCVDFKEEEELVGFNQASATVSIQNVYMMPLQTTNFQNF